MLKSKLTSVLLFILINASFVTAQNGWFTQQSHTTNLLNAIYFTDQNIGYASGGWTVLKTTNGGSTWDLLPQVGGAWAQVYDIHFTDYNTGFLVGNYDLLGINDSKDN